MVLEMCGYGPSFLQLHLPSLGTGTQSLGLNTTGAPTTEQSTLSLQLLAKSPDWQFHNSLVGSSCKKTPYTIWPRDQFNRNVVCMGISLSLCFPSIYLHRILELQGTPSPIPSNVLDKYFTTLRNASPLRRSMEERDLSVFHCSVHSVQMFSFLLCL